MGIQRKQDKQFENAPSNPNNVTNANNLETILFLVKKNSKIQGKRKYKVSSLRQSSQKKKKSL